MRKVQLRIKKFALKASWIACLVFVTGCGANADRSITPPANPTPRPDPDRFLRDSKDGANRAKASEPMKRPAVAR
jgi:hypothetical protein